jgi:signal transduction histidine kinase
VIVRVTDHGIGIPEDELTQITRKFVRGRRARPAGAASGWPLLHVSRRITVRRWRSRCRRRGDNRLCRVPARRA